MEDRISNEHSIYAAEALLALTSSFTDLQPVRRIDEAEAQRISNRIDEELRVRLTYPAEASECELMPSCSSY